MGISFFSHLYFHPFCHAVNPGWVQKLAVDTLERACNIIGLFMLSCWRTKIFLCRHSRPLLRYSAWKRTSYYFARCAYNERVSCDRCGKQDQRSLLSFEEKRPYFSTLWLAQCSACLGIGRIKKGKGSPYSITERRVPELIAVHGSQPAGDVSHKPGGSLSLLSARHAVTPATLTRASTILLLGEQRYNGCEQFA